MTDRTKTTVCGITWKFVRVGEWRSSKPTRIVSLDPKGGWWASHWLGPVGAEVKVFGETFSGAIRILLTVERIIIRELRQPK